MLNIYLIRHGETAWNADNNRYCGRTDIPLTEKGMAQAKALQQQLKNISFDAVYSSPLQRAYTTAQIASGREVIKDVRLVEADFGNWERKTKEEFIAEDPQVWNHWIDDPATAKAGGTGETASQIVSRVDHFFGWLQQQHTSGHFLIAAHNGVNRFYLAHKLGMPLRNYRMILQENSSATLFTLDADGSFQLHKLNSKW